MTQAYSAAMPKLLSGESLSRELAEALMGDIMVGDVSHPRIAAVLTALAHKGAAATELTGFAAVMRAHARKVPFTPQAGEVLLDTCGTGGSGLSTANTSTMSAFVLAAAGVKVAKHGNRSSSGRCGSIDVLERLGVDIEVGPDRAAAQLTDGGITFLFAPLFHPAVGFVMPVRRELGFRTVFNFLGPLCNPAAATHQVLGVSDERHAEVMASALCDLGSERVLVVHGDDGLDELTLQGPSHLWHVQRGGLQRSLVSPAELGLTVTSIDHFGGGEPEQNAALFTSVLQGRGSQAHTEHLALNAGAALWISGVCDDLGAGVERALELIAAGAPWDSFLRYREAA